MPVPIKFAGQFRAVEFAYGLPAVPGPVSSKALFVDIGSTVTGSATLTLGYGYISLTDGTDVYPLNVNAPILVGSGSNQETVTPTAVTDNVPTYRGSNVTATFANTHGTGDPIASGTAGLQEAINYANSVGGGQIILDALWTSIGGTTAMIAAAVLPASGIVTIIDNRGVQGVGTQYWQQRGTGAVIAAPAAATSGTVASQTGTGTWPNSTEHVLFTYVTASGGETVASSDFSFTATLNKAIGGSGPAAVTGAVGYNVYIGLNATTTCFQVPPIAANGTIISAGAVKCFQIGTPFSVALATTAAGNLIPVQSSAFGTTILAPSVGPPQPIQTITGPWAVTGVISSGTPAEQARVALPAGFLNFIGRTLRVTWDGIFTPVSTAGPKWNLLLSSVYGTTSVTLWTVTMANTTGTTASDFTGSVYISTAATGTSGTLEVHGTATAASTTATANIAATVIDTAQSVSSTIDLTAQDFISLQMDAATANITQSQVRRFRIEVLA